MLPLQTTTYQLEAIEQAGPERYYLLTIHGASYKIGELIYLIVDGLARQLTYQEIGSLLNASLNEDRFSAQDVATVVQNKLTPMGLFGTSDTAAPKATPTGAIAFRRRLLAFEQYEWLLRLVKYAFSPAVFFSVLGLALLANVFLMRELMALEHYVTSYTSQLTATGECGRGATYLLFFYPAVLFILISHELGHAAASYRFGVKPKEIGIGLYLIFPVLYADVTEIWRLNKTKRVIVNLGGFYVQLLINLLLIWFLVSNFGNADRITISRYLIQLNVAMMVINTIPFIKLDGYWLYSDLFSLPNLQRQASVCLMAAGSVLFPRWIRRPNLESINVRNPYLIFYTVGRYVFLLSLVWWGGQYLVDKMVMYPRLIGAAINECTLCTVEPLLKTTLTFCLFGVPATRSLAPAYHWVKRFRQLRS
ncbi:M50 family metallopeptidase [Spirosoma pollinicola]|uniref:Peptidase M50 n=1 Tax=Spirosoma pollinicola TaxID=2057025 RepID=A0A2K8Z3H5_9BACT|nr:M50 family metallopeptidase [Spirosoma pollinicola]AUD04437.1 hypothetical protein CWM47_22875 [Spirosoma pollinicola]